MVCAHLEGPAVRGSSDLSGSLEGAECFSEAMVVDLEGRAEPRSRKRTLATEGSRDPRFQGGLEVLGAELAVELEVAGGAVGEARQVQEHGLRGHGSSVLKGQEDALPLAEEVGIGVSEGMQIRGAAQTMTRLGI
jgi:hypothetical protein